MKKETIAYKQGDFDSLCGIYTLINAVDTLKAPNREKTLQQLFNDLINELSLYGDIKDYVLWGIETRFLSKLIKSILVSKYEITCKKPFHSKPDIPIDDLWHSMVDWTDNGGVIICGDDLHWTLVVRVTERMAYIRDSSYMSPFRKQSLIHNSENREIIQPTSMFFLSYEGSSQ